jgi:dTDP-4-amino-4,6-dideoxy-D-galactose acyltransferase
LKIAELEWDSRFLGFRTGKVVLSDEVEFTGSWFERDEWRRYRLLYLLVDSGQLRCIEALDRMGFEPVTVNLLLRTDRFTGQADSDRGWETGRAGVSGKTSGQCFPLTEVDQDVLELALAAGHHSRFRLDKRFEKGTFEAMYHHWIKRSVAGELADFVYGHRDDTGRVNGLITGKVNGDSGHIGLMAVQSEVRGQGIGTMLLDVLRRRLLEDNTSVMTLLTQAGNEGALSFYEKSGFRKVSETRIYHWWNENAL